MNPLRVLSLTFRTARHMSLGQAFARLTRPVSRMRAALAIRRVESCRPGATGTPQERWSGILQEWLVQEGYDRGTAEEALAGRVTFRGASVVLGPGTWRRPWHNRLWTYHLHYCDFVRDLASAHALDRHVGAAAAAASAVRSWVLSAPPGVGLGWDPYPTSTRIINWCDAALLMSGSERHRFLDECGESLYLQCRWLSLQLERHLAGNHLMRNLAALIRAAVLFGPHRMPAFERTVALFRSEVDRQFLHDGFHYERSLQYHRIVLKDVLETVVILKLLGYELSESSRGSITRALSVSRLAENGSRWLWAFQDSSPGDVLPHAQLARRAREAMPEVPEAAPNANSFSIDGYVGVATPGFAVVIDAGTPSPSFNPGHAHACMLSLTADYGGRPFLVDPGVHGYDGDAYREYCRSTRAHNTVQIGSLEQHEMWATFRIARRGRVHSAGAHINTQGTWEFTGECSPYWSMGTRHRRRVEIDARGRSCTVTDTVSGHSRKLTAFFHLAPEWRVTACGSRLEIENGEHALTAEPLSGGCATIVEGQTSLVQGWVFPSFAQAMPAPVIEITTVSRGQALGLKFTSMSGAASVLRGSGQAHSVG